MWVSFSLDSLSCLESFTFLSLNKFLQPVAGVSGNEGARFTEPDGLQRPPAADGGREECDVIFGERGELSEDLCG